MKFLAVCAGLVGVMAAALCVAKLEFSRNQAPRERATVTALHNHPAGLWTCGMHPQVIQDHPGLCPICHMKLTPLKSASHDGAGKSAGGPTVTIDPTVVQNMGIRTTVVTRGPLEKTVRAVGMLAVPEPSQHDVNLKVNGWIKTLYANQEGMHLHKGEPLFELYSPDLQVAEEELIGAVKALNSLDADAGDAVRSESQSLVDSAKQKLRLWDVADTDIDAIAKATTAPQTVPFRSPADGDLMDKMVVEGSAIQAGMKVMRIEDHAKLWLDAQVYEGDLPLVALGLTVQATVNAMPGHTYSGPITFISPHVDQTSRTVTVRITLDNPRHELSPGMFATANIVTKPVADTVLAPREAVIDTGARQIAFVAKAQGHFEPRIVRMGITGDDDQVQILEGLAPGEIVVTSGQFLLDVESRTIEAIDKLRQSSNNPSGTPELMHPTNQPARQEMP